MGIEINSVFPREIADSTSGVQVSGMECEFSEWCSYLTVVPYEAAVETGKTQEWVSLLVVGGS